MEAKSGGLTPQQQAIRSTGIGASETAAIVGRDQFKTAIDVYKSKVSKLKAEPEKEIFKRGRHLEAAVLGWYEEEMGVKLDRQPSIGTLRSKAFPHVVATPDAYDSVNRVNVQAKTHRFDAMAEYGAQGTDQIPTHELIQVTMEMGVLGCEVAHLPVLFGGDEFRIYHVPFSNQLFQKLGQAVESFWEQHVSKRVAPPVDGSPGYAAFLAGVFAERKTKTIKDATASQDQAIAELLALKPELEALETREGELKNLLRAAIGDDYGIKGAAGKAIWTGGEETEHVDWKEYARALAELVSPQKASGILQLCITRKPSARQLRVSWAKEGSK